MLKILTTSGSSNKIEDIISEAKEFIVLVTPYLKITSSLMSRLIQADGNNVKIFILYGKNDISSKLKENFNKMNNCNLYFLKNLHAKCYYNESFGIISSLDLHEYSQVYNWELGICFDSEDEIQRNQIFKEIDLMLDSAEVKIEKFERFRMVRKSITELFAEYLNQHFNTNKFVYSKSFDKLSDHYKETITAKRFPKKNLNIEVLNDATRVDFIINLSERKIKHLTSQLNFNEFINKYRVYQNNPDTISLYMSLFHREKWYTYSDQYKYEYLTEGIERTSNYIQRKIEYISSHNRPKVHRYLSVVNKKAKKYYRDRF
ncbi:MAG: phospholipase D-like domain-containing protein [Bacteroidota bacterium]